MARNQTPRTPQAGIYEYAFTPVPTGQRKRTSSIFIVTTGYVFALSSFSIGSRVGYALPFGTAMAACFVGNLLLLLIGVLLGRIGCRTGLSTTFLVQHLLGRRISVVFSLCTILLSINWIGVNGDMFARMIIATFRTWPLPVSMTAVLLVFLWCVSASRGWVGLEIISWITIPVAFLLTVVCMALVWHKTAGFQFLSTFIPSGSLSFTAATAAIVGNFVFGCLMSPDTCRFASSPRAVDCAQSTAYALGLFLLNICGVILGQAGNHPEVSVNIILLGLSVPFFLCSIFSLWATEYNNIYSGSLAMQNLVQGTAIEGNLSHTVASCIIGGLGAAFAALGAQNYSLGINTVIAVLLPPVFGLILAASIRGLMNEAAIAWPAFVAWGAGGCAGGLCLWYDLFLAPMISILVSFCFYLPIHKWALKKQDS